MNINNRQARALALRIKAMERKAVELDSRIQEYLHFGMDPDSPMIRHLHRSHTRMVKKQKALTAAFLRVYDPTIFG